MSKEDRFCKFDYISQINEARQMLTRIAIDNLCNVFPVYDFDHNIIGYIKQDDYIVGDWRAQKNDK